MDVEVGKFTCFPKLPLELRQSIWKRTLPGPRLLPFCAVHRYHGQTESLHKLCWKPNSFISITNVCQEAREVVERCYSRLEVRTMPSKNIPSPVGLPFLYVDFILDTILIDPEGLLPDENSLHHLFVNLSLVKHLAIENDNYDDATAVAFGESVEWYRPEDLWDIVRGQCRQLESLRYVVHCAPEIAKRGPVWESALVDLPPYDREVHGISGYYGESDMIRVGIDEGPILSAMCTVAGWLPLFKAYAEKHDEWSNVKYGTSLKARREKDAKESQGWILEYYVHDWNDESSDGLDFHGEAVHLGDGNLYSLSMVQDDGKYRCKECGTSRWETENDAYWLIEKTEGEFSKAGSSHGISSPEEKMTAKESYGADFEK